MQNSGFFEKIERRVWIFPALALITVIIGQLCKTSCSFIQGDILGIDLNVFGILFYSTLIVSLLFYQRMYHKVWVLKIITAAVSLGVGAEIILIKFQIQNSTYCPKCLISGFFFLIMFFLLARNLRKWVVTLLVAMGLLFASFTFNGSVIPSYAAETPHPVFGKQQSQTGIIVYSDYLCPACRGVDVQINEALLRLKDKARIEFVDVPMHQGSLDYAQVFLYGWFSFGNNLEKAVRLREVLFHAAEAKSSQAGVFDALKSQGIPFKIDPARAGAVMHDFYNSMLKEDRVKATPTVVVVTGKKRKAYVGGNDIMKALKALQ